MNDSTKVYSFKVIMILFETCGEIMFLILYVCSAILLLVYKN